MVFVHVPASFFSNCAKYMQALERAGPSLMEPQIRFPLINKWSHRRPYKNASFCAAMLQGSAGRKFHF